MEVDAATGDASTRTSTTTASTDNEWQQAVVANTTLVIVPPTPAGDHRSISIFGHSNLYSNILVSLIINQSPVQSIKPGIVSAANAFSWLLDHTSWPSDDSTTLSEQRLAVVVAPPSRHHRNGVDVNTDVVALLHLLPSLMLPGGPGHPCDNFRQAAETYRLALQGVGEGRWNTVPEVMRGLAEAATAEASGSARYCRRWRDTLDVAGNAQQTADGDAIYR